jgi:hypothetical protein
MLVSMQEEDEQIKLNVGGQQFITSKQTLSSQETILKVLVTTSLPVDKDDFGAILIEGDHNPEYFTIILDFLRTGKVTAVGVPDNNVEKMKELLLECDYFGTGKLSSFLRQLIKEKSKETNLDDDEVEVSEPRAEAAPKQSEEVDEEWLDEFAKLTLEQSRIVNEYLDTEERTLQEKKNKLDENKEKLAERRLLRLNVGGRLFDMDRTFCVKHKECILNAVLSEVKKGNIIIILINILDELFIDRDPDLFSYVLEFLRTNKTAHIPIHDANKMRQIREEAKYFNINALIDFFDPLRYPVEIIGEENIRMRDVSNKFGTN